MRTKKAGRPFVYQSEQERPVSVSIRIPHALYDAVQDAVGMRRTTLTGAILEGLRCWLDTPADPRELIASDDNNTVMQELREMVAAMVQAELAKREGGVAFVEHDIQHDNSNTVLQEVKHDETPTAPAPRTQRPETVSVAPDGAVPMKMRPRGHSTAQRSPRTGGRPRSALGERILAKLADHPEGLSAEALRVFVQAEKPIGDILSGMKRRGDIIMHGQGKQARYVLA